MPAPGLFDQARGLTREQRNAFLAAWLGWAMDAFDFFLVVFVLSDIAKEFGQSTTTSRSSRRPRSSRGRSGRSGSGSGRTRRAAASR
jgi:hypothetical protein